MHDLLSYSNVQLAFRSSPGVLLARGSEKRSSRDQPSRDQPSRDQPSRDRQGAGPFSPLPYSERTRIVARIAGGVLWNPS